MASIPENGTNIDSNILTTDSAINLLLDNDVPAKVDENVQKSDDTQQEVSTDEVEETEEAELADEQSDEAVDEAESEQNDEEITDDIYIAKVDGEEIEVSAEDLIKSYQLEQTAQKRLRDVAEQRKTVQAEQASLEAERKYYAENIEILKHQIEQNNTGNLTKDQWQELYDTDPMEYMKAKDAIRDREVAMQRLQQEQMDLQKRQIASEQQKLIERIPEWRDTAIASKEKSDIVNYAKTFGFSDQEIANTVDSRIVDLLRRAYMYDNLQTKKTAVRKKVKSAPKMLKAKQPKSQQSVADKKQETALNKLTKSGRKEDALAYMLTRNQ